MKSIFPISFFLLIALMSCNIVSEHKTKKNWTTIRVTSDWLIDVPNGYERQEFPGIDSETGSIYSKNDSINLEFESWNGTKGEGDYCDPENQNKRFNQEIKSLKTQYSDREYEFMTEKINSHLALIVYPKDGKGDYHMEVHNCEVGSPLVIEGKDMNNQKMILEIFRTVRYKSN